ncbi:RNA ligase 1 family protein [Chitinophaga pinensis]|uniref:Uncharacterized protein n=1 Tax=Chitinophaga pinensis (strain ATCC 43595 / DSM 2588 / LMG 13176 / NBRC 15968 / NCIMB 11800 / UQM 2034) TaxID=485918 RepID=A0A979G5Q3_CHIPD|nr:DUF5565 family protein [Chitinophaga pinensis]ACU61350.1 hypothetical protein Cpin_3888 [Chitinophaga pinensis DSM 2588]
MKKIPSLFVRDYERIITDYEPHSVHTMDDGSVSMAYTITGSQKGRFLATKEVTPGCEWVVAGEGKATRKWDGTAVLKEGAELFRRYDAKHGKTPPDGFRPCQDPDPITGHWPGWVPVDPHNPADKYICEAFGISQSDCIMDGTYEAIGPKINGNREKGNHHRMVRHGSHVFPEVPRDYDGLKRWFEEVNANCEGIVFHHPDGRMCKVKRSDFGLPW